MATPKEAAILWIIDGLGACPKGNQNHVEETIQEHYPHYKMTTARMEKIQEAYEKEVARIKKMYAGYLKGRGIKE